MMQSASLASTVDAVHRLGSLVVAIDFRSIAGASSIAFTRNFSCCPRGRRWA